MSPKAKIILIIGGIILFIGGWAFFVVNMLGETNKNTTDIIDAPVKEKKQIEKQVKKQEKSNLETTGNINIQKNVKNKVSTGDIISKVQTKKIKHSINILTYSDIINSYAEKIFALKYKKITGGTIYFKNYNNINKYKKELIYKLATKSDDFDLAIIPAEWFENIKNLSNISFKLNAPGFEISSIFDYNFDKYIKNNNIKAIPFAIDPIIGYTTENIDTYQTFNSWKNIIITSDRLKQDGKIKTMPILLGYDNSYLKYLLKTNKSLLPVFDYILNYYIHKKAKTGIELLKEFGEDITYKTFDFKLFIKLSFKYRKYKLCKNKPQLCFILGKDSKIVYDFLSSYNFYDKNKLNIFRYFKLRPKNIKKVTLALNNSIDEYPARGYIIIINPKIDNKKLLIFLKTYIKMGKDNKLPFYKNLISPFNGINPSKENNFLSKYLGRFITSENFGIGFENTLSQKEIQYLKGDININLLF